MVRAEKFTTASDVERKRESPLISIDPSLLLKDNPAAIVLDAKVYAKMSGVHEKGPRKGQPKFDPDRYEDQRTEVVRVVDPTMREGFRRLPIDGHHRTKAADEFQKGVKNPDNSWLIEPHPEYVYLVKDVTDDIISREGYQDSRDPGRPTMLTSEQYLEEVIDQAEGHESIASARTVAHLIERWPTMAGAAAEDFSMLAALSLLGRPGLKDEPNDRILKYFIKHANEPLMGDETPVKRVGLEEGLMEMAGVIRKRRRGHNQILTTALDLIISTDPEKKLSEETSAVQIRGLLYHPDVHSKLTQVSKNEGALSRNRMQLQEKLIAAFREPYPHSREVTTVYDALMDQNLDYQDVLTVITNPKGKDPESPTKRYRDVRHAINMERVKEEYKKSLKPEEVFSNNALNLIASLCSSVILEEGPRGKLVSAVLEADRARRDAEDLLRQLNAQQLPEGSLASTVREQIENRSQLTGRSTTEGMLRRSIRELKTLVDNNKNILSIPTAMEPIVVFEPTERDLAQLKARIVSLTRELRERPTQEAVDRLQKTIAARDQTIARLPKELSGLNESDLREVLETEKREHTQTKEALRIESEARQAAEREAEGSKSSFLQEQEAHTETKRTLRETQRALAIRDKELQQMKENSGGTKTAKDELESKTSFGNLEGGINWDAVEVTPQEGTLSWFQSEKFDPTKATKMLATEAYEIYKNIPGFKKDWPDILAGITYKNESGEVSTGYDALMKSLVRDGENEKNIRSVVLALGLEKDSPEFAFLAASFISHAVSWTPELSDMQQYVAALYEATGDYQKRNKTELLKRGKYLAHLIYVNRSRSSSNELMGAVTVEPFDTNEAEKALKKVTKEQGSIKGLFQSQILRDA